MKHTTKPPQTATRTALLQDIAAQMDARLETIEDEFQRGFELVGKYDGTVTVFGSARFTEDNPYYQQARELGGKLAQNGFTVITGGGAGIMEAANRGAFEAGGNSIGFNIALPHEQQLNPYVTETMAFQHFYARKVMLVFTAGALVVFPGGFGTLDEMFEVLTLVQTHKTTRVPIILVGTEFWKPLDEFIKTQLRDTTATISVGDELLYHITDDLDDVISRVEQYRDDTVGEALLGANPEG